MAVVDIEQWREKREAPTDDTLTCRCGSAWFELVEGAVSLNRDRSITGYAGMLHCVECDAIC